MIVAKQAPGFELWCRRRGARPTSMATYRSHARYFETFLTDCRVNRLADITPRLIADFQTYLMQVKSSKHGRPLAVRSRAGILVWLRLFFLYLIDQELILIDPTRHMRAPRLPHRLPRAILTPAEMRRLLRAPDTRTFWGLRDRTLLEIFYGTGLRFSELADLQVGQVDVEDKVLWVRDGKGRKDRVLPLGRWAAHWLKRYLAASAPLRHRQRAQRLILTPSGARLGNDTMNTMLTRYAARAKIAKPVTAHTLRHTFATVLIKAGADVRHVQKLLGHKSLATTEIYTHLDLKDLRRAQERYHPRERRRRNKR